VTPCSDVVGYNVSEGRTASIFRVKWMALAQVAFRPNLSVDLWGQGIEPCVSSWPDLDCTGETAAGDSYCYLSEGKRDQTGVVVLCCGLWPLFPYNQSINCSHNDSKPVLCRPVITCWTVVINVTMSLSLALLYSSDDGHQLEDFPALDSLQLRRGFPWRNSFGSEVPTGGCLTADTVQFSPMEHLLSATTPSVLAGMLRLKDAALR
jgi:hypothetical protein